jgi:hypothetical protein
MNLQIQPTNDDKAKYMDTNIWVKCLKILLHSSTIKLYQSWEFQMNEKIDSEYTLSLIFSDTQIPEVF